MWALIADTHYTHTQTYIYKHKHLKLLAFEKLIFSRSYHKLNHTLTFSVLVTHLKFKKFVFYFMTSVSGFLAYIRSTIHTHRWMDILNAKSYTFNYKLNTKLNVSEIGCRKYAMCFINTMFWPVQDVFVRIRFTSFLPNNP